MTNVKRLMNTSMLVAAGIATSLAGWGTFALFSDQARNNVIVTSGNFDVTLGALAWNAPGTSGAGADALAQVSLGDGDVLVFDQALSTHLTGHNLQAAISIDWTDAPAGVTATWHIADASGRQVAPESGEARLDQALTPPAIVGPGQGEWRVVVTAKVGAGYNVYGDPADPPAPEAVPLGVITITASQVRG